ncbi:MAG: acetylxylan esterase [Candidatus Latescibacteria bacterium]|jgi:dienelactone hydrolase|nr:acetylxylan esterase [Candidatus Latescibacterota bacterium]
MQLGFANNKIALTEWQQSVRDKLLELTRFANISDADWRLLETSETVVDGVRRRRHLVAFGDWTPQPIYEMLPADAPLNGKTLIALHGHGLSPFGGIYDYLDELPRRGYRCVLPILYGTMERNTKIDSDGLVEICRAWLTDADMLGASLLGLRLFDCCLAHRFALSFDGVDSERVGVVGLSMGGELALYLAAVEPSIARCVSAGFLST